jgi:hypothetical protein
MHKTRAGRAIRRSLAWQPAPAAASFWLRSTHAAPSRQGLHFTFTGFAFRQQVRMLDAWLRDWRESARVLIQRRDHQIRMGLAERRTGKGEAPELAAPVAATGTGTE